jgi:hypothetical protein
MSPERCAQHRHLRDNHHPLGFCMTGMLCGRGAEHTLAVHILNLNTVAAAKHDRSAGCALFDVQQPVAAGYELFS